MAVRQPLARFSRLARAHDPSAIATNALSFLDRTAEAGNLARVLGSQRWREHIAAIIEKDGHPAGLSRGRRLGQPLSYGSEPA